MKLKDGDQIVFDELVGTYRFNPLTGEEYLVFDKCLTQEEIAKLIGRWTPAVAEPK